MFNFLQKNGIKHKIPGALNTWVKHAQVLPYGEDYEKKHLKPSMIWVSGLTKTVTTF